MMISYTSAECTHTGRADKQGDIVINANTNTDLLFQEVRAVPTDVLTRLPALPEAVLTFSFHRYTQFHDRPT